MTDDEYIDPLHDPRFPNRPQHPDYWRLSDVGLQHDGKSMEAGGLKEVLAGLIDEDSLRYFTEQRLGRAMQDIPGNPPVTPLLIAIYFDAFCLGADFINRGGHREP